MDYGIYDFRNVLPFITIIMKLEEIAKLPKGSYLITDPTKLRMEPLDWSNYIHFYFGSKHKQARRSSAFVYGLCEGVIGQLPPVSQQGGFKQGCGAKPKDTEDKKVMTPIWTQKKTVDLLGGKEALQKKIIEYIKTLI